MKKIIIFISIICFIMFQAIAQEHQITGVVQDESGAEIPGATVFVEGTSIGTITDAEGKFLLNVNGEVNKIAVSFIGYKKQIVEIGGRANLVIRMEVSNTNLEEVVVVGYGTQKKVSVVGSISTVDSEDLVDVATPNLSNSLAGRVSGLIIKMNDGRPGADDPLLSIRGASTINDISPLVLIDGMEGDLGRINPSDIESFSVLKDASATAVYGVRGANGVILITTKHGIVGKPVITANGQYRVNKIINFPQFLDSYHYALLYNEALINVGSTPFYSESDLEHYRTGDSPYTHPNVNWYDEMVAPYSSEQNYDINLQGGTEKVRYFVAGEFLNQEGAYRQWENMDHSTNANYTRFNLRMNLDFKVTNTTDIGVNMNGRIQNVRNIRQGNADSPGMWYEIALTPPNIAPTINPDGSIGASDLDDNNGYANLRAGQTSTKKENNLTALLSLNQKLDFITKGLAARYKMGINTSMMYNFNVNGKPSTYKYDPLTDTYDRMQVGTLQSYGTSGQANTSNPYVEAAITYDRAFGNHKVTGLALYNQDKKSINSNAWTAHRGFAGRITYSFLDKYLGEINVGYNGSTQFEKQERYALFPSFSAGWIVSNEAFFKEKLPMVSFFKLRGSYGLAGNDKIGNYQYLYLAVFDQTSLHYNFGDTYNNYETLVESTLANEDVSWEIAKKQNYGFDLRLFDDLFGLGFDYFIEHRSDILAQRNTVTRVSGLQSSQLPAENFGKVDNRGFEFEASFRKSFGDFSILANGTFSHAKNKIVDIDEVKYDLDYRNQTGKSIGQYFGYTWTGEYYTFDELGYVWDESVEGANKYVLPAEAVPSVPVPTTPVYPGDLKFVDRNSDGVIDDADSGNIGRTSRPEFVYGLNYTLKYKNFALTMFWQGAGGFSSRISGVLLNEFQNNASVHEMHLNRWAFYEDPYTGELIDTRATATYPRLVIAGSTETKKTSTFNIFKGDYLKLKNIEFSYDLPKSLLNPVGIKNATLFLTASNVLTLTKVKWIDPERRDTGNGNDNVYPQSSYYGIGFNIGF